MPDDPIERTVRQYIAHGAGEGAMSAAQRLSEAVGIGLDEILAARVTRLREEAWRPG